ncbi:MAG: UDP-N-acetylmuramoyl-tripeptide--D-alanyl-D-alanine ligase [Candidatus Omnitrophica bacterium]|nr:UDP-N-acetylmuramoyl-tripeptide--D-alanyl-D-alanine ligase [Candidatus Omnitrophota bacterium]
MESLTISEILKFCHGVLIQGNPTATISSIFLDSRKIEKNSLFIAIRGERHDGHDFLKEALEKGAGGAIVESSTTRKRVPRVQSLKFKILIQVGDTRKALGDIARAYRRKFKIPLIAITGSDGKTTTKELAAHLLSSHFHLVKSPGNFNNEIGLPLTLFKLKKKNDLAIVELGMNKPGEIKRLSEIAKPTVGVITNIGNAHQGFFKSKYGIAQAKAELFESLGEAPVILNKDSPYFPFLKRRAKGRVISFGIKKKSDFWARDILFFSSGTEFKVNGMEIRLPLLGYFNVYNVLCAIALAKEFGISNQEIKKALQNFKPLPHHFQLIKLKRFRLIDDTYNSNPFAFEKVIEQLLMMKTSGRRVIIAGEMKELGKFSKKAHYSIGKFIAQSKVDFLVTVGKLAKEIGKGAYKTGLIRKKNILHCQSNEEVVKSKKLFLPGDLILIKGSRAAHLEEIVEKLKNQEHLTSI